MNKILAYPTYAAAALSSQTFGSAERFGQKAEELGVQIISPYVCRFEHDLSFAPSFEGALLVSEPGIAIYQRFFDADSANYQLDQPVIELLGFQSYQRIQEFKRLRPGWSFGEGKSLSARSLTNMEAFLKKMAATLAKFSQPMVYLNAKGEIEMLWEGSGDTELFVRFHSDDLDFLVSPGDVEGTAGLKSSIDTISAALNDGVAV